jgi:peptidoglycan-associated lipoprotein
MGVRDPWGTMARWAAALCCVAVLAGGCAKKRPSPEEGVGGGEGIGEQGLGGAGSLDRARQGLGPEEGGPLKDVHFDYDSDDINEAARAELDDNVSWLRDNPKATAELEGHCDNRGTIEYNLGLGAKRTKAVQDYLVGQGVAAERLKTISYGKELPLCQQDTEECWARNRRVHSAVLGQ